MSEARKKCLILEVFALIICIVFMVIYSPTNSRTDYDISFAAEADATTTSVTITATSYPDNSFQDYDWNLEWDTDKTAAIHMLVLNNKEPTDYVSISPNGADCLVSFVQYYKPLGIKNTVYLKLTARSVENQEAVATCTIKL